METKEQESARESEIKKPERRKIKIQQELLYLLAILVMTFSVALMEKADFGLSMVVSPAFLLSEKLGITFGTAEMCLQILLVLALALVTKQLKISFFGSFVTAVIYGFSLDFFDWLLRTDLPAEALWLRIFCFVCSAFLTPFSVALFFHTYLPACAYDFFVKEASEHFKIKTGKFKFFYDLTSLAVSLIFTFSFFGRIEGLGIATFICTFTTGPLITLSSKWIEKYVSLPSFFPRLEEKLK